MIWHVNIRIKANKFISGSIWEAPAPPIPTSLRHSMGGSNCKRNSASSGSVQRVWDTNLKCPFIFGKSSRPSHAKGEVSHGMVNHSNWIYLGSSVTLDFLVAIGVFQIDSGKQGEKKKQHPTKSSQISWRSFKIILINRFMQDCKCQSTSGSMKYDDNSFCLRLLYSWQNFINTKVKNALLNVLHCECCAVNFLSVAGSSLFRRQTASWCLSF